MRRAELTFTTIVQAIIVLAVLGMGTKVVWDLTGTPVRYLLGKANISAFDDELVERFNLTKEINKEAVDSVNTLMFAINNLAYIDTYSEKSAKAAEFDYSNKGEYARYEKSFGTVSAKPTYYDRETVFVPAETDLERGKRELAFGTISCWLIFKDKGNSNTRCYSITFEEGYGHLDDLDKLKEDSFMKWMIEQKNSICNYFSGRFKGVPIKKCIDTINEITGDTWNPFNVNNIEWDELPSDHFASKEGREVSICANNRGLNEIFFHKSSQGDICEAPTNALAFGYKVKNFSLPQKIEKSSNALVYGIEDWLYAYGDPDYVLFYEKFPQEEAQYWDMSEYNIPWGAILITEGIFLGIDVVTLGMGKALKPVGKILKTTRIGRGTIFVKNSFKNVAVGIGKGLKWIFSRPVSWILRKQVARETMKKSAKGAIENRIQKVLGKKAFSELDDTVVEKIQTQYLKAFDDVYDKGSKQGWDWAFDTNKKRFTPQGLDYMDTQFKNYMKTGAPEAIQSLGKNADDIIYQIGKELSEQSQEATFRSIPKALLRTYKVANRARNLLKEVLTGDMTEEAREKALKKMLLEGDEALSHMKPVDLRAFMANQQKAKNLLLDEKTGGLILGEISEEFNEQTQKQALKRLDDLLEKSIETELVPKTGLMIQSFSSKVWEKGILKKRHLVAAMVAYMAARTESMAEKNYPVGTNAIGLKSPYMHTVSFDGFNTGVNYTTINKFVSGSEDEGLKAKVEDHKDLAEKILKEYGRPGYQGLLPEVERYYLSLTKDLGLFDQDPQRFHLVSPCETDILIEISRCECWYHEDEETGVYETGKKYEIMGEDESGNPVSTGMFTEYDHFDDEKSMLYTLDENGDAVKQCHPSGVFQFDDLHAPKCIKINPLMDNFGENNYCYHGIDDSDTIWKGVITAAEVGLPMLGLFCGPAAPACIAGLGFVTGLGGELIKEAAIDIPGQWPSHD